MKTGARLVLERRFRQWANGKSLAVLSAATLLGVVLSSAPADAQVIDSSLCYGGSGGPTVSIFINNSEAPVATKVADSTGVVDLSGDYASGATAFSIAGAADGFSPIAYVDKGTGVSLLVVTDVFITSSFPAGSPPAKLKLVVSSANALGINCPGGTHTFAATMDGAVLADTGAVSVTATADIPNREATIVINRTPGDQSPPSAPSMVAGVVGSPLKPGGIFSDAVVEDSACGTFNVDGGSRSDCTFRLRNTIEFTFNNSGDIIYSAGSFKAAALEGAVENLPFGVTGASLVLGSTGVPFDRFNAAVATQRAYDTFEVGALVRLGVLSNGIDPVNEPFRLRVGAFAGELPPHSFVQRFILGRKIYTFDGTIDDGSPAGSRFKAVITPLLGRDVSVLAVGHGAHLTGDATLVDVTIGSDDGGGRAKVFPKP